MVGPTIDPSVLQGLPGSSLHWSVAWIEAL